MTTNDLFSDASLFNDNTKEWAVQESNPDVGSYKDEGKKD